MIRTANVQEPYSPAAFPSLQALYSPGPLGPFAVSTLPPAFRLFYHSGFENGSPRPIFRFGNLFRLRELPHRRQSPEGRRRITLRRRGLPADLLLLQRRRAPRGHEPSGTICANAARQLSKHRASHTGDALLCSLVSFGNCLIKKCPLPCAPPPCYADANNMTGSETQGI